MAVDDFATESMARLVRTQQRAQRRARARGLRCDDAVLEAISQQVLERLPLLLIEPTQLLDLGCRGGQQFDALAALYPNCAITGVTLDGADTRDEGIAAAKKPRPGWLNRFSLFDRAAVPEIVRADPHFLPFDDQHFDLVVSNLCLPFCQNPKQVFMEVARVLKPGGAFLFSSLGPDTLLEYRQLWAKLDRYPHVSGLIDMHDLGDSMLGAGLADPVLDRDTLRLEYPSVAALENELQVFGLVNLAHGRRRGLLAPTLVSQIHQESTPFSVGLELVHGHAWKAEHTRIKNSTNDEYRIPVSELKGSWKR